MTSALAAIDVQDLAGHEAGTFEIKDRIDDVLGKPLDSTFVIIEEVDTDNWGWGGLPAREYRRRRAAAAG